MRRGSFQRAGGVALALLALAIIGWNLTGEITAANSSNSFSSSVRAVLVTPPDWIDRATGRARTMFIGQGLGGGTNAFYSLQFWNQSIEDVWSVDASAGGPGPGITPNYLDTTGVVYPQLPLHWIVAGPGVEPVGQLVDARRRPAPLPRRAPDSHRCRTGERRHRTGGCRRAPGTTGSPRRARAAGPRS